MSSLFDLPKKENISLFTSSNSSNLFNESNNGNSIFSNNLKNNSDQKSIFSAQNSNIFNLKSIEQNLNFTSQSKENEKEEIQNEDKNFENEEEEEEENEEKTIKIIHINEYFIYINEKIVTKSKKLQKLKINIKYDFDINNENLQLFTLDNQNIFHELNDENEYIKLYENINELYLKYEKIEDLIGEQNNYDFVLHSDLKNKEDYRELMTCSICLQEFNNPFICPNCEKKICEDCFMRIRNNSYRDYLTCPLCKVESEKKLYIQLKRYNDGKILLNDSITKLKKLQKICKICDIHNETYFYYDFITKELYCQKCYDEIEENNDKKNHKFIILNYYQNLIRQNEILDMIYKDEVQEKCLQRIELIKESKTKIIKFLNDLIQKIETFSNEYINDLTKISNDIKFCKENNFSDKIYEYFNSIENNMISCKSSNDVIQKIYKFNLKKYYDDIIISKKYYYKYPEIEIDRIAMSLDEKLKEGILFIKQFKYIGNFLNYSQIDCRIFGEEKSLYFNFKGYFNEDCEKTGKGTFNDFNKHYKYIGDYIKNNYNGYGKYYFKDNLVYDGQFKEGKFHGLGKYYKGNNVEYIGQFINNGKKGYGIKLDYDIYGNVSSYNKILN